jgi:cell division protein FtsN
VQVGKQSAALRHAQVKGAGEELEELPATMAEQLKALELGGAGTGFEKPQKPAETKPGAPGAEAKPEEPKAPDTPKPAPAEAAKQPEAAKPAEGHWTLQLVSTPDAAEARAVAGKAKAAGFKTETITEKGLLKVRLTSSMERKAADASIQRLRNHGFKPFAIKVD